MWSRSMLEGEKEEEEANLCQPERASAVRHASGMVRTWFATLVLHTVLPGMLHQKSVLPSQCFTALVWLDLTLAYTRDAQIAL
jgi:hypothetical protein